MSCRRRRPNLLHDYKAFHAFPTGWERSVDSLCGYGELLQGCAYRDGGTTQGYLLYRNATILDLACAPGADAVRVSAVLLGYLSAASPLTFPKVNAEDPQFQTLQQLGLKVVRTYRLMGAAVIVGQFIAARNQGKRES